MAKEFLVASDSNASFDQIKRLLPAETVVIANDGHEIVSLLDQHPDIGFLMLDLESLRRNESILVSLLELAKAQVDYRERSLLLDVLFKQAPIGISLSFDSNPGGDTASDFVTINPMFAQITGWSEEEMISKGWASITHPDDLEADLRNYRRLQAGEIKSYTMEKRFIKPDGSVVWVDMIVAALKLFHEDIYDHLCMIKDITERKEIERILTENEHSKSMLLANLQGLAYRCLYDREWTMQYVSEGCLELTGYPAESLLNNKEISYKQLIAPEYQELLWNEWARILPLRIPFRYEYQIVTASGERKWVLEMGEGIYNSRGEAELLDGMIIDITEQKQTEITLKYRTEHDTLTGLYNRAYLESLLEVDARSLYRKKRALIAINLRDIVELTPYFGFHYTQDLIRKVSRGLRELCSDRYDLYHTYENRFTYYVRDCQGKDQVIEFLQQLVAKLEELLEDERVGAGIGVLEIEPDNELDANQLLKQLLIASERAQEDAQGGFHYSFFDAEMEAKIAREEAIKSELQRALSTDDEESLYL